MQEITPDIAKKLLAADDARLISRLKAGKTLTVAQRARVEALASGSTDPADGIAYVTSWVELGAVLGVTRGTINRWLRQYKDAPKTPANRQHNVPAWRAFVAKHGLGVANNKPDANASEDTEELKRRKLLAEIADREHKLAVRKGEYVPIAEVREAWATGTAQATSLLRNMLENEVPPLLAGMDAVAIRAEMGRVIDAFVKIMHEGGERHEQREAST